MITWLRERLNGLQDSLDALASDDERDHAPAGRSLHPRPRVRKVSVYASWNEVKTRVPQFAAVWGTFDRREHVFGRTLELLLNNSMILATIVVGRWNLNVFFTHGEGAVLGSPGGSGPLN